MQMCHTFSVASEKAIQLPDHSYNCGWSGGGVWFLSLKEFDPNSSDNTGYA